mmetsp:Transcript_10808/g.22476  ORF Transcript_10808/g.22476 Transcript_10808/m.22476 type:complete len:394 (-) Transcript_10808:396-1577(-)
MILRNGMDNPFKLPPDPPFHQHRQPHPLNANPIGSAPLVSLDAIGEKSMIGIGHVKDSPSSRNGRRVGLRHEVFLRDEHSRRGSASETFVGREVHSVFGRIRRRRRRFGEIRGIGRATSFPLPSRKFAINVAIQIILVRRTHRRIRIHIHPAIRSPARVIEQRQRLVPMQNHRDGVDVGDHPRDVARGRKGPQAQSVRSGSVFRQTEQSVQFAQVDHVVVGTSRHRDDLAARLPPGEEVRVVFVRAHEHHRPRRWILRPLRRFHPPPQIETVDQQPHRARDAVPGEEHRVHARLAGDAGVGRLGDDLASFGDEGGGLAARVGDVGVGVGVAGEGGGAEVRFDGGEGAVRGGVVAVDEGDGRAAVGLGVGARGGGAGGCLEGGCEGGEWGVVAW